jgi:hypothetical protein
MHPANNKTKQILDFFINQSLPPVTASTTVALPDLKSISPGGETKAYEMYAKHYYGLKLQKTSCSSQTVSLLTDAVNHAELAIVLWQQNGQKEGYRDEAASMQVEIYRAGNWLRRFAYERVQVSNWFDAQELEEVTELTTSLKNRASKMFECLKMEDSTVEGKVAKNEDLWKKEDSTLQETARVARAHNEADLKRALHKIKNNIQLLRFFVRELKDSRGGPLSEEAHKLIEDAAKLMTAANMDRIPPWRNQGISSLGPFGIQPVLAPDGKPSEFLTTNFKVMYPKIPDTKILGGRDKKNGEYIVKKEFTERYRMVKGSDGQVKGTLSPFFLITIPNTSDVFKLIRIPSKAKYFTWAYPIVETSTEIEVDQPSSMDLFLILGGYIYFDKNMNFVQANALTPLGFQLQFSNPNPLPADVYNVLNEQNRFRPITIDALKERGATHFAWVLPGEFSNPPKEKKEWSAPFPHLHAGAFAYKYDDPAKNNYFVLAAVETVTGKEEAKNKVEELD